MGLGSVPNLRNVRKRVNPIVIVKAVSVAPLDTAALLICAQLVEKRLVITVIRTKNVRVVSAQQAYLQRIKSKGMMR